MACAALALGGCQKMEEGAVAPGRYGGLGHYTVDDIWKEMARGPEAAERASATLGDDSEIIVVVDSRSGEVRQCGNHSGYCVSMKPWARPAQPAPLRLARHAADLEAERTAEWKADQARARRPAA